MTYSTWEAEAKALRARVAELELALERTADACLILMSAYQYEGDRDAVLRHADAAFGGRFEHRMERERQKAAQDALNGPQAGGKDVSGVRVADDS